LSTQGIDNSTICASSIVPSRTGSSLNISAALTFTADSLEDTLDGDGLTTSITRFHTAGIHKSDLVYDIKKMTLKGSSEAELKLLPSVVSRMQALESLTCNVRFSPVLRTICEAFKATNGTREWGE
jgi:hypothetical protein